MAHFEGPGPSNSYVSLKRGAFSSIFIKNVNFRKCSIFDSKRMPFLSTFGLQKGSKTLSNFRHDFLTIFEPFWLPFWVPFGALGPSTNLKKSSWDPPWSSLGRQMLPHAPQMSFLDNFRPILGYFWTNFERFCTLFCIKILPSKEHSQRKVKGGRRSFAVGVLDSTIAKDPATRNNS